MAKIIGIVGGNHADQALKIKAAILRNDPQVAVLIDEELIRKDASDMPTQLRDKKIGFFNAVDRLGRAGADVVGFSCLCPATFLPELQKQTDVRLINPARGASLIPVDEYAQALLAAPAGRLPRPFKVGMIGGLGPAATVDLYDKIVKFSHAVTDQEHMKLVVEQNPQIPDRTKCLLEGGEDPTLALYNCAKRLQDDGCDCLIVPCNTAHAFVPYLERHLEIPFINIQQTTMDEIKAKFGVKARVGLLATAGTVQTGIYSKKAEAMGIAMFAPDAENEKLVMNAIYGPQGAKAGFTDGICREELLQAAEHLVKAHECNVLILGCTELPLILDEGPMQIAGRDVFIIDATSALARRVVEVSEKTFAERGVR